MCWWSLLLACLLAGIISWYLSCSQLGLDAVLHLQLVLGLVAVLPLQLVLGLDASMLRLSSTPGYLLFLVAWWSRCVRCRCGVGKVFWCSACYGCALFIPALCSWQHWTSWWLGSVMLHDIMSVLAGTAALQLPSYPDVSISFACHLYFPMGLGPLLFPGLKLIQNRCLLGLLAQHPMMC